MSGEFVPPTPQQLREAIHTDLNRLELGIADANKALVSLAKIASDIRRDMQQYGWNADEVAREMSRVYDHRASGVDGGRRMPHSP